jgi:Leucine-rich repeat (LRR) protein
MLAAKKRRETLKEEINSKLRSGWKSSRGSTKSNITSTTTSTASSTTTTRTSTPHTSRIHLEDIKGDITPFKLFQKRYSVASERFTNSLEDLRRVRLDRMEIERMDGIMLTPNATHIYLQHNKIQQIPSLSLHHLSFLILANNEITELGSLKELINLNLLDLQSNRIKVIGDVFPSRLQYLMLRGNPIDNKPDYRLQIVQVVPTLVELDEVKVRRLEKRVALHGMGYFLLTRSLEVSNSSEEVTTDSSDSDDETHAVVPWCKDSKPGLQHGLHQLDTFEIYSSGVVNILERSKQRKQESLSWKSKPRF